MKTLTILILSLSLLGCTSIGQTPRSTTDNLCSALIFTPLHITALIPAFFACTFGADAVLMDQVEEEEECDEDDDEDCE